MHMGKMCGNVGPSSFLLLMIVYPCVFAVSGQNCTCEEIKCQDTDVCASTDSCNIQNVAYRKRASMSSFTENHLACTAVNGDNNTVLKDSANCAESAHTDYNAWWAVDLGQKYNVSNITVYRDASTLLGAVRMADLVLKVDDHLCFNFPTYNSADLPMLPAKIDILCDPPITGQVIRLEKVNPKNDSDYYIITICEVQVWVTSLEGTTTSCAVSTTIHADTTGSQGDTTSIQRDTTSSQVDTTSSQMDTTSSQRDTTSSQRDTTSSQVDTTSSQRDTTSIQVDTTSSQRDTTSSQRETTGSKVDTTISYGTSVTNRAEATIIYETTTPNLTGTNASAAHDGETSIAVIVGPVVGGAVLLIIIVLIVMIIIRRMRRWRRKHISDETDKESGSTHQPVEVHTPIEMKVLEYKETQQSKPIPAGKFSLNKTPENETKCFADIYMHTAGESRTKSISQARSGDLSRSAPESAALVDATAVATVGVDDHKYQNNEVEKTIFMASRPNLDNVQRYLVDRLASGELRDEFDGIESGLDLPRQSSNLETNFKKNRFASIQPYDSNRVVLLDGYDRSGATDFVNASYISGYTSKKAYIAAQGPRDNTVVDFWRMVWQEKITNIVMLTNVVEAGKNKCWEYWPAESSRQKYGPFAVTNVKTENRASFVIRTFKLKYSKSREDREVVQYHYVSWPDHDVPKTTSLITFWRFVMARRAHMSTAPILVHCSAGVGRSGTFIGLDIGFQMAVKEGKVDVPKLVKRLREERCWMVQAQEQYEFVHRALLEAYTARDTFMSMGGFVSSFSESVSAHTPNPRIDTEFKTLLQMQAQNPAQTYEIAEQTDNASKNRNLDDLPPDRNLVFLTECLPDQNQYINAVFMSTFWHERGCIVTQLPLPDTLVDFWRMVYGEHVQTVVSLAARNEEAIVKPYCWYWPRGEGERMEAGPYTVHFQSKSKLGDRVASYTLKLDKEGVTSGSRAVRVLRYEDWTEEFPANTPDLLHLVHALDNTHLGGKDKKHPGGKDRTHLGGKGQTVVIQCSDGVSKCGLFNAICDVMHRMTCDREVDVYMTIRQLQTIRPKAVTSEAQYRYLYELVQRQAGEMSVYANI